MSIIRLICVGGASSTPDNRKRFLKKSSSLYTIEEQWRMTDCYNPQSAHVLMDT